MKKVTFLLPKKSTKKNKNDMKVKKLNFQQVKSINLERKTRKKKIEEIASVTDGKYHERIKYSKVSSSRM